jgi:hypothetical protein
VSENTKLNSSYVPRGTEQDLIAKLVGLEAPGSDDEVVAQDRENILYLNGSGFAGKSELLLWARDRCGQKDKDEDEAEADHEGSISLVRAHGQVVFASQSASGADHIDAWAGTITTMRQELQAEATRLGLEAPKFPIFDAFHARCVDEHRDRSFRKTVGIITGALGFLAIAAGVFDFVSIPDAARYLADFIDSRLARPIEVLFYIISVILVLNGSMKLDLAPWLIKLRDRWWKSGKYVELGANPLEFPERLAPHEQDGEASQQGKWPGKFNENILICAFNRDLSKWLEVQSSDVRLLLALDMQELPPSDTSGSEGLRSRIREAADAFLGRCTAVAASEPDGVLRASGEPDSVLHERAPIVIASKFVDYGGDPDELEESSPLYRALGHAERIGFLTREEAWSLVAKLVRNQSEEDPANPLWQRMLRTRDLPLAAGDDPWSLLRVRNTQEDINRGAREFRTLAPPSDGTIGDYHLMILQIGIAFGPLTAKMAIGGDHLSREYDARLAGYVKARMANLVEVARGLCDKRYDSTDEFLHWLQGSVADPSAESLDGTDSAKDSAAAKNLMRTLEQGNADVPLGACLLAPFPFGLRREDIETKDPQGGLGLKFDRLEKSPKFRLSRDSSAKDGNRLILKNEDRRLILNAGGHKRSNIQAHYRRLHEAFARQAPAGYMRQDSAERASIALSWIPLLAAFEHACDTEHAMRLIDIADRVFTLGGYSALSEENNELLRHRLGEIAMRYLAERTSPERYRKPRWDGEKLVQPLEGYLEDIVQRYMRRFGFGQMDSGARTAFVQMLRGQGSDSPVVRDLAVFLARDGGSVTGSGWREEFALMIAEKCQAEAFDRLMAMDPGTFAPEDHLEYLRLLRKAANSLAGQCLNVPQHDWQRSAPERLIANAERTYLEPMFARIKAGMEALPEHTAAIAFMALRTSVYWQKKVRDIVAPELSRQPQETCSRLAGLVVASRRRQAEILGILQATGAMLSQVTEEDFVDLRGLLGYPADCKGEDSQALDAWLLDNRRAFFVTAAQLLDSDGNQRLVAPASFLHAAAALAIALSANFGNRRHFLPDDATNLWPSMVRLREAYCDFAARRFAAAGGANAPDLSGPGYLRNREKFAGTNFYAEFEASEAVPRMVEFLLRAVAHVSPKDPIRARGHLLAVDRFAKVTACIPKANAAEDLMLCQTIGTNRPLVIAPRYAPTRRWTEDWKALPTARRAEEVQWQGGRPVLVFSLEPADRAFNPGSDLGEKGVIPPETLVFSARGPEYLGTIIDTFLPLIPPASDRFIRMGGSNSIAVIAVSGPQRAAFNAGNGLLAMLLKELASLYRVILFECEAPPVKTPRGPAQITAEERKAASFLLEAMDMTWYLDGDDRNGSGGYNVPAAEQTEVKGWRVPALLPRYLETAGTYFLMTLHPNPVRPTHSVKKLRTVHGLFPKIFEGMFPNYEFDHVDAMMWPAQVKENQGNPVDEGEDA